MLLHLAKQSGTVNPSLYTITDWREQTKTLETVAGGRILAGMVTSDFPAVFTMPLTLGRLSARRKRFKMRL